MEDCEQIAGIVVNQASSMTNISSSKRRKVVNASQEEQFRGDNCLFDHLPVTKKTIDENSAGVIDGDSCSSCCYGCHRWNSDEFSCEVVKKTPSFVDLEDKSFVTETSTFITNNKFRETTPDEMESPPAKRNVMNHQRKSQAEKMPTEDELEEFFSVSERDEQRRFAEKYNYDIVKDVPLDGRYQWIRLKP